MTEQMSATIISFPRMKAAPTFPASSPARTSQTTAEVKASEADPQRRLQLALAALDRAVADQRAAIAKWRESLGELRSSVQGLGQSLGNYNERLGVLADDVGGLNREARRMEAWADGVLAKEGVVAQSES
jgi:chromosome segregation ATPase